MFTGILLFTFVFAVVGNQVLKLRVVPVHQLLRARIWRSVFSRFWLSAELNLQERGGRAPGRPLRPGPRQDCLAGESVNIQMMSTSEIKISVVVAERYLKLAVRALHDEFELEADG